MRDESATRALGHNEDRMLFCNLCDWSKQCCSMEHMEMALTEHLRETHGLRTLYRVEDETQKLTTIPQFDD